MIKSERFTSLDYLRVLAFIMVVAIHLSTGAIKRLAVGEVNWYIATLIDAISRPAVHIFILLGGFLLGTREVTPSKAIKRALSLLPPLTLFATIFYLVYVHPYSTQSLFDYILTFVNKSLKFDGTPWYGHLWFLYPYALLMLISPIINIAIVKLEKKTLKQSILTLVVLFFALPSINLTVGKQIFYVTANPLMFFVTSYMIGGYIRRFGANLSRVKLIVIFTLSTLWSWGGAVAQSLLFPPSQKRILIGNLGSFDNMFMNEQIAVLVGAVSLFLLLLKSKPKESRLVTKLSAGSFFAYTIHYMILFTVTSSIEYSTYIESPFFIIYTAIIIAVVSVLSLLYGTVSNRALRQKSNRQKTLPTK